MSLLDFLVLIGSMVGIAVYGTWRRVYFLVAASFILWVILLRVLTVMFA